MKKKAPQITLTEAQQDIIRMYWDKDPLDVVAQKAFGNPALTLNSPETLVVRAFVATLGESPKPVAPVKREKPVALTEDQKNNIRVLMEQDEPPTVKEVVEMIYGEIPDLSHLHGEYRLVHAFIKEIREDALDMWDEPVDRRRYNPPVKLQSVIGLANRYVGNPHEPGRALYDLAQLKKNQEANLHALLSYLQTSHFVTRACLYQKQADRDLFESTFVRHVHDKAADILPEEVDIYITIAVETVRVSQFDRDIALQERVRNNALESANGDENKVKLSMSLVESISTMMTKRDSSSKLVLTLINNVAGKRAERLNSKGGNVDMLINWLNLWMAEKTREDMLAMAEKHREEDEQEFDRIKNLDQMVALMAGLSKEEAATGV